MGTNDHGQAKPPDLRIVGGSGPCDPNPPSERPFDQTVRGEGRRPPPREAAPPLRPALAARSRSCAKLRFSLGTLAPPRRAISRRRSGSIAAKPRRLGVRPASSFIVSMTLLRLLHWSFHEATPRL